MRYTLEEEEATKVIENAINFANSSTNNTDKTSKWAKQVKQQLKVIGSKSNYAIRSDGRVQELRSSELTIADARRAWNALTETMNQIILDRAPIRAELKLIDQRQEKLLIDFKGGPDLWACSILHGNRQIPETKFIAMPTVMSFALFASQLVQQEQWRKRLNRCSICNEYFLLSAKRLGGPKHRVCGEECKAARTKRQTRERVRRYRSKMQ